MLSKHNGKINICILVMEYQVKIYLHCAKEDNRVKNVEIQVIFYVKYLCITPSSKNSCW